MSRAKQPQSQVPSCAPSCGRVAQPFGFRPHRSGRADFPHPALPEGNPRQIPAIRSRPAEPILADANRARNSVLPRRTPVIHPRYGLRTNRGPTIWAVYFAGSRTGSARNLYVGTRTDFPLSSVAPQREHSKLPSPGADAWLLGSRQKSPAARDERLTLKCPSDWGCPMRFWRARHRSGT